MKKKKICLILMICFLLIMLVSCAEEKTYEAKDYILELDYKEGFKILQLSDIHMANKDDRERQYDFLDGTIKESNADLIVITGDLFTFADKTVAKELFEFLDSYKIHWTLTFGNHDEQCYFSIDWLTGYLNELNDSKDSYCVFKDLQDDDVMGNSNFVINLMESGKVKEQLILMDSNRYNYGEYTGYDYIKQNQIDWYSRIVDYTKEQNGGVVVPSLLFFHIPLPEFDNAWNAYESGDTSVELIMGDKREKSCPPLENSGFFDKILEKGSTKGIFVGHDHVNNFILNYKGIYLGYCVNSTDRIYYEDQVIGGTIIQINSDNTLTFDQILRNMEAYE